jgi:hypothetical protein
MWTPSDWGAVIDAEQVTSRCLAMRLAALKWLPMVAIDLGTLQPSVTRSSGNV